MNILNLVAEKVPTFISKSFDSAAKIVSTVKMSVTDKLTTHYFREVEGGGGGRDIKTYGIYQFDNYSYPRFASLKKSEQGETLKNSSAMLADWNMLWNLCFGESNSYTLKTIPFERVYAMKDKTKLIGVGGFIRMHHNIIQVQSLAIHPLYRKCGYATRILLEIIKQNPNTIILLGVLSEAPAWQHEYTKHGFRKVCEDDYSLLDDSGSWLLSSIVSPGSFLILNPYIKK